VGQGLVETLGRSSVSAAEVEQENRRQGRERGKVVEGEKFV
jgi:hypothetical protein